MPTSSTEIDSVAPIENESTSNEVSCIISLDSEVDSMNTLAEIPTELVSSGSPLDTIESADNPSIIRTSVPMLTDIAEETIYETEFFEESMRDDYVNNKNLCISEEADISNILIETIVTDSNENTMESEIYEHATVLDTEDKICDAADYINDDISKIEPEKSLNLNGSDNCFIISDPLTETSTNEELNLVAVSNNTNLISEIFDNSSFNNIHSEAFETVKFELVNGIEAHKRTRSDIIQIGEINDGKTFKPFTVQSGGSKFLPVSIAPENIKRPAEISVGEPSSNIVTKVVVNQGRSGQPFVITNSPSKQSPICILPSTSSGSSPVKSITAAQAKQMGFKLQAFRPSSKTLKQNMVISNVVPSGAQMLKKIQSLAKTTTPPKILPAPLVSKSISGTHVQKIILHPPDYLMKSVTKPANSGQMITISNLQNSQVVPNNLSPKKKVQYIKLVNNVGSTNLPTITTAKPKITVTHTPSLPKIDKDASIIVASSNFSTSSLNTKTTKSVSGSGVAVLSKAASGQRLILPAATKAEIIPSHPLISETKQTKQSDDLVVLMEDFLEKLKSDLIIPSKKDDPPCEVIRIQEKEEIVTEQRMDVLSKSPPLFVAHSFETGTTGNGLKSRKPCNCTRSQCLKLYCECFANGEFCNNCNCVSCHNNISHEENRQNAIKSCLDRNPQAFRPKIGKCLVGLNDRRHTKGCHCKRSGCLKNYCECYEAQIPCSENCKCMGCKNIDDMLFATTCSSNSNNVDKVEKPFEFQSFSKNKLTAEINDAVGQSGSSSQRHAFSFIKDQVVEATCQCLLAQAEDVKRRKISIEEGKKYILEEFGRCLIQIIECAPDKYLPS